jgi:hypothetical protein
LDEVEGCGEVAGVERGLVQEAGPGFRFWIFASELVGVLGTDKVKDENEKRTIRIELQDLQIHVCVCDDEMKLFVKGQEFYCHGL